MAERRRALVGAALAALVLLAAALFVRAVIDARRPPDGPVPVVWDREACAHCGMLISDPFFAAQLQTDAGDVLNFDDPGCLLRYEAERSPGVHAAWFHHRSQERWLPESAAAFVAVARSPMGYGLAAAQPGEPGALSLDEARSRVRGGAASAPEAERP